MSTLDKAIKVIVGISLMLWVVACTAVIVLIFFGCGSGNTKHDIYVHGETKHTANIDVSACDEIEDQVKKDDCILAIAEALANATEAAEDLE